MTQPLDIIMAFHNAFRRDIDRIDTAALETAQGNAGLTSTIERYRFFNEMLIWHATGEEQEIYPILETVAPQVAEAYVMDHHGLDIAGERLHASVSSGDSLHIARASAAFKFHLDLHLDKEEAHLYRLFRERVPLAEQGKSIGQMASHVPQERFPEVVTWLFPLLELNDRENTIRIFQMVLPAPVFAGVKQLVQKAIGNDWVELTRRVPALLDT